jgi:hypothetical protein
MRCNICLCIYLVKLGLEDQCSLGGCIVKKEIKKTKIYGSQQDKV